MGKKKADIDDLESDPKIALLVMHCCCLGLLFYVNFLVRFFYGFPALQNAGGSIYYEEIGEPNYYIKVADYPWSLSSLFFWLTLIASGFVIKSVWYRSMKQRCKWRLRFLSLLMSFFCFGFAALNSHIEDLIVKDTEIYILFLKDYSEREADDSFMKNYLLREIRLSEEVLERWKESQ